MISVKLCDVQSVRAMQSCVGPSSSHTDHQAAEVRRASSSSQSQSAASKQQADLRKWQSTSGKPSQSQSSDVRNTQHQQQADVKRKLPEWMSSVSSGKTATKKKLKNSSLFSWQRFSFTSPLFVTLYSAMLIFLLLTWISNAASRKRLRWCRTCASCSV